MFLMYPVVKKTRIDVEFSVERRLVQHQKAIFHDALVEF